MEPFDDMNLDPETGAPLLNGTDMEDGTSSSVDEMEGDGPVMTVNGRRFGDAEDA